MLEKVTTKSKARRVAITVKAPEAAECVANPFGTENRDLKVT